MGRNTLRNIRLDILYSDMSTAIKWFDTRKEALFYVHSEGDHVWQYKITRKNP